MGPFANYLEHRRAAYLYHACARAEAGNVRAELFGRLAGEAEAQAAIWRARITSRGLPPPPPFAPDLRTRLVGRLVELLGPRRMRSVLAAMRVRGMAVYATSAALAPSTAAADPDAPESHHRSPPVGGNLRTAVFGVNDGLVSNASLILGVAGAGSDPKLVLVSGIAGLAAGAFAMAAGEYVSVRAQRELFDRHVGRKREELAHFPEAEAQELALIYAAKGLPQREATRLAKQIVADPDHALDTLAREELGVNPGELGSPVAAASGSLVAFAGGAAVPLVPLALAPGPWALALTVGVTGVALVVVGSALSLFTGRGAIPSGVRMLLIGALAGGVTFGIGRLFGVALG